MTDEELDEARAREAASRFYAGKWCPMERLERALIEAAKLAREGWVPVDPDLIEARQIAVAFAGTLWNQASVDATIGGKHDGIREVKAALHAIKRGRELERGQ